MLLLGNLTTLKIVKRGSLDFLKIQYDPKHQQNRSGDPLETKQIRKNENLEAVS